MYLACARLTGTSRTFEFPYAPVHQIFFNVTVANANLQATSVPGMGVLKQNKEATITLSSAQTYAIMSFCYYTDD